MVEFRKRMTFHFESKVGVVVSGIHSLLLLVRWKRFKRVLRPVSGLSFVSVLFFILSGPGERSEGKGEREEKLVNRRLRDQSRVTLASFIVCLTKVQRPISTDDARGIIVRLSCLSRAFLIEPRVIERASINGVQLPEDKTEFYDESTGNTCL